MANVLIGHVKGPQGDAATVAVGTVTTGAAGSSAAVTNSGTSSAATLNFTIPKGDKGDPGDPGVTDYATASAAGLVRVGSDFNINSGNGTLSINKSNLLEDSVTSTSDSKALTANQGNKLAKNMATVESSSTASKAYSVGDFLVYNGILYKVTTAIASGGTIKTGSGANVSAATLGGQIASLNSNLSNKLTRTPAITLASHESVSLTVSNNAKAILYTLGSMSSVMGEYLVSATSVGTVICAESKAASSITVTTDTNEITLANSSSATVAVYAAIFSGTVEQQATT